MKKIITIVFTLVFGVALSVNAQQGTAVSKPASAKEVQATNPNIERMRIVNEKLAAEKAAVPAGKAEAVAAEKNAEQQRRAKIASQKAALRNSQPASK